MQSADDDLDPDSVRAKTNDQVSPPALAVMKQRYFNIALRALLC